MTTRCSFCIDLIGGIHITNFTTRYRHMQRWIERQNLNPILPRPVRAIAPCVRELLAELDNEQMADYRRVEEVEDNTWEGDDLQNLLNRLDPMPGNAADADEAGDISFIDSKRPS